MDKLLQTCICVTGMCGCHSWKHFCCQFPVFRTETPSTWRLVVSFKALLPELLCSRIVSYCVLSIASVESVKTTVAAALLVKSLALK